MREKQLKHNGNSTIKMSDEERENRRLRELLQRAVNRENAPESLREKLRKMIRE